MTGSGFCFQVKTPKATRRSRMGKSICPGMDGIRAMQEQLPSEASDTRGIKHSLLCRLVKPPSGFWEHMSRDGRY